MADQKSVSMTSSITKLDPVLDTKYKEKTSQAYQNKYLSDKRENRERQLRVQKLANRIFYMQTEERRAWNRVKRAKFKTQKLLKVKEEKRQREFFHFQLQRDMNEQIRKKQENFSKRKMEEHKRKRKQQRVIAKRRRSVQQQIAKDRKVFLVKQEINKLEWEKNTLQKMQEAKNQTEKRKAERIERRHSQDRNWTSVYVSKSKGERSKKHELRRQEQLLEKLENNLVAKLQYTQSLHNGVYKKFKDILKFRNTRAQEAFNLVSKKMKQTERSFPQTTIEYNELIQKQNIKCPLNRRDSRSLLRAKLPRKTKPIEPNLSYKTAKRRKRHNALNTTAGGDSKELVNQARQMNRDRYSLSQYQYYPGQLHLRQDIRVPDRKSPMIKQQKSRIRQNSEQFDKLTLNFTEI